MLKHCCNLKRGFTSDCLKTNVIFRNYSKDESGNEKFRMFQDIINKGKEKKKLNTPTSNNNNNINTYNAYNNNNNNTNNNNNDKNNNTNNKSFNSKSSIKDSVAKSRFDKNKINNLFSNSRTSKVFNAQGLDSGNLANKFSGNKKIIATLPPIKKVNATLPPTKKVNATPLPPMNTENKPKINTNIVDKTKEENKFKKLKVTGKSLLTSPRLTKAKPQTHMSMLIDKYADKGTQKSDNSQDMTKSDENETAFSEQDANSDGLGVFAYGDYGTQSKGEKQSIKKGIVVQSEAVKAEFGYLKDFADEEFVINNSGYRVHIMESLYTAGPYTSQESNPATSLQFAKENHWRSEIEIGPVEDPRNWRYALEQFVKSLALSDPAMTYQEYCNRIDRIRNLRQVYTARPEFTRPGAKIDRAQLDRYLDVVEKNMKFA